MERPPISSAHQNPTVVRPNSIIIMMFVTVFDWIPLIVNSRWLSCSCFNIFLSVLSFSPSLLSSAGKPINIVQGLENAETFVGGEALFECALSRPENKDFRWFVDGKPIKESPNFEIVTFENGRRHLLLLKDLGLQDSCTVTFKAGTATSSAQLSVKGEFINILDAALLSFMLCTFF